MPSGLTLHLVIGKNKKPAVLGTYLPVQKQDLIKYVKHFPLSWVRA